MRVLDLFSGLGGFSAAFRQRGHEVVRVDLDPRYHPEVVADVRLLRYPSISLWGGFDVVLASPPCQYFSVARAWHGYPAQEVAEAVGTVATALRLVSEIRPTFWVLENPRGKLRHFLGSPRETIFLCGYGLPWQKPTDLWGIWPGSLLRRCAPHLHSPDGRSVFQGVRNPAVRAKLPYALGEELCVRIELALASSRAAAQEHVVRSRRPPSEDTR